jgi:hypothetical protein
MGLQGVVVLGGEDHRIELTRFSTNIGSRLA